MTQRSLKIGLIQSTVGLDKAANVEKTVLAIRDAVKRGASLICLQELFATQYFCQSEDAANFDLAEPVSGPT
ncbi:MAG TPA: nitrilase-related carbon-nitrogen hydrolase, partial [Polyangiaceae bacterium]|nr:nitrilase-related carbon-nitrogen hydrolase [Polyangiaceae bacterium]